MNSAGHTPNSEQMSTRGADRRGLGAPKRWAPEIVRGWLALASVCARSRSGAATTCGGKVVVDPRIATPRPEPSTNGAHLATGATAASIAHQRFASEGFKRQTHTSTPPSALQSPASQEVDAWLSTRTGTPGLSSTRCLPHTWVKQQSPRKPGLRQRNQEAIDETQKLDKSKMGGHVRWLQ